VKFVARVGSAIALIVFLLATGESHAFWPAALEESPKPAACITPEHRQFDFWIGDWDAFDAGTANKVARTRVDRILNGCVLQEQYEEPGGLKGQSFTIYDTARKIWHQSWVTNRGRLLAIEGKLQNGEMVLSGIDGANGSLVRGTWKAVDGGVREMALTATDNGTTWKPWFDLMFRPHDASADDPVTAVAALDKQYQAAVKKNDAAAMDRILADDFTLVTGSGQSYTKADLLNEARSGRVIYEQQNDSAQAVRVWGDTAIVTARLHAKGTENGKSFDYVVWFSDTYVKTPTGWRYVFGQSSLRLPEQAAGNTADSGLGKEMTSSCGGEVSYSESGSNPQSRNLIAR